MEESTSINPYEIEILNEIININDILWNVIIYNSLDSIFFKLYKIYTCTFYYESKQILNQNHLLKKQFKKSIKSKEFSINEKEPILILKNGNNQTKIKLKKKFLIMKKH